MRRRIRLSGGESAEERAWRLADADLAGWRECVRGATNWQSEARRTGFVAGFLACLQDEVPAPPESP